MKFASLFALASAAIVTAQDAHNVEILDFVVHKFEDPLEAYPRPRTASFTISGYGANNVHCVVDNIPTFPSDILPCNAQGGDAWRVSITTGVEGSGIQFGLELFYMSPSNVEETGYSEVPTRCRLDKDDQTWMYTCPQLVPTTITVEAWRAKSVTGRRTIADV